MLPPITTFFNLDDNRLFNILPTPQINTSEEVKSKPLKRKIVMKFSKQEDTMLSMLVMTYGNNWKVISEMIRTRNPRQCRDRWCNYINPKLSNSPWSPYEDLILIQKYSEIGPHWSKIAKCFPNRSDNNVKKRWKEISKIHQK